MISKVLPLLPHDVVLSVVGGVCAVSSVSSLASSRVKLLGKQADLEPLLNSARVFVSPVPRDTVPGIRTKSMLALQSGLPLVTTWGGGTRGYKWQSGDAEGAAGAIITDPSDATAFATAVKELISNEERWSAVSTAAIAHARTHFSSTVVASQMRELLDLVNT